MRLRSLLAAAGHNPDDYIPLVDGGLSAAQASRADARHLQRGQRGQRGVEKAKAVVPFTLEEMEEDIARYERA